MTGSFGPATRNLNQQLTYWSPAGLDGYNQPTFATGIPIMGRWNIQSDTVETGSGQEIVSKAVIHVDRDLEEGGYLYQGLASPLTNTPHAEALEIQAFLSNTDLRNMEQERRAYL